MTTKLEQLHELEREHGIAVQLGREKAKIKSTLARLRKLEPAQHPAVGSRFIPDTSEWSGHVDWPAVKAGGVTRGIAKASQYREDWQFAASWRAMHAAGFLARGAYHFFTEEPAATQAGRLLAVVDAAGGLTHPFQWDDTLGPIGDFLAIDFEKTYGSVSWTRTELEELVSILHHRAGQRVLLYTGGPFWNSATGDWANDLGCIPWHAAYVTNPNAFLPACWHPSMSRLWQFTDGHVGNRPHAISGLASSDLSVTIRG
jgi:GH25 family lysozyme M1 (1,4-beta-N-acetylmuramidase)